MRALDLINEFNNLRCIKDDGTSFLVAINNDQISPYVTIKGNTIVIKTKMEEYTNQLVEQILLRFAPTLKTQNAEYNVEAISDYNNHVIIDLYKV